MISIFAKRAFLNTSPNTEFSSKEENYHGRGHLQRVSSMIRGDQIADFLGAKFNPEEGYQEDVCIYVKPHLKSNAMNFKFEGSRNYLDIIDGWGLIPLLEKHPEVGVIACSKNDAFTLRFLPNKIVTIPQHHCNFERIKTVRKGIRTVGVIGTEDAFAYLPKELAMELEKRGIKLLTFSKFFSRQDIIDFYLNIDVQLVWRPYRMRLSNPLKIVNAASFGVPTIAYDEEVFAEVSDCYIGVKTLEEILFGLDTQEDTLRHVAQKGLKKAEEYHIENIAKLYQQL